METQCQCYVRLGISHFAFALFNGQLIFISCSVNKLLKCSRTVASLMDSSSQNFRKSAYNDAVLATYPVKVVRLSGTDKKVKMQFGNIFGKSWGNTLRLKESP